MTTSRWFGLSSMRPAALAALAAAGLGVPMSAAMAQPEGDGPPATSWGLGLGVASKQKAYAGIERDNKVLPLLMYENRYVRVFGPEIGLKLPSLQLSESQSIEFSVIAKYDGSGYEADDAPILNGMDKRKGGVWAGGKLEWKSDLFDVGAEWVTDASGNSKGQRISLGVEKTWHFGPHVMLTPRVGASWHDKKYVDYYYGVRSGEARLDRPGHVGKSGANAEVGLRGIYMFDKHQSLMLDLEVTGLAKSVKDSPLVNRSNENRVFFGYMYRF